ncbi:hypothetical protein LRS05_04225 [Flavobacterium sp. J372]|uniref:hypothetical protein n=1 Tax=Flavobacterium sp. J372 TaxID=2898436 RepID=UPI0021518BB5|nr:hypothetical protein [Flavobacterium sp. J372]MCR5861404.1 hypothetical protein [Flavobacterium sp. J372]
MKNFIFSLIQLSAVLFFSAFTIINCHAQELELDSVQIKMIKSLGHEQLQLMIERQISYSSAEDQAKFKHATEILKLENPAVETVVLKNKTVKFIPISHAAQKKFYENLSKIIKDHKKEGYVVFYEQMKATKASSEVDTLRLKFRKILPVEPTRKMFSLITLAYPDVIAQPEYDQLGITDKDVNADITIAEYIAQYEKLYGPIKLEPCDFETKPGAGKCKQLQNNLDAITIDFRNTTVANMIKASKNKKILVVYGAQHIPGIKELIQKR